MRVVLDTNVVVSAAISPRSAPARIIDAWGQDEFDVLLSPPLLAEYRRALAYDRVRERHKKNEREIDSLMWDYASSGILVHPDFILTDIVTDPDDNRILECAIAGTASHIVTGDLHLLELRVYRDILIVTPRAFVDLLDEDAF